MIKDVLKYLEPNACVPIDMATTTALVNALKEALAQRTEQEPDYWLGYGLQAHTEKPFEYATALYRHPLQRKPLTNGEIYTAYITATNQTLRATDERLAFAFARAIEAAHGIKEKT
jgi:hypothetical protein